MGQKRRLYTIPLIAVGISALLLVVPLPAYASLWSLLAELVLWIAKLIGGLVITLIDILIQIVQYNDFINAPAVSKGWVIVRDVVNMFVIVMMLVIAFATTFRIEEYQYKKLLSRLLIMSVLVNFSKMLTGFFIDFAQVIMLTFVNGFKEAAAGNFVNGFKIQAMFDFAQNTSAAQNADSGDFLVAALLALISLTITLIVVAIYLVVFLLRIVFLWMLVILSPMAYVLSAFPGQAKKYSTEWWEYFGKYLTAGPILAFFLWLSLAVMQFDSSAFGTAFKVETKETAGVGTVASSGAVGASISKFGQSDVLLSFIINIILLLGGLWMTQKLGVAGGKLAGAALAKIQSAGASIAKAPFKAVGAGIGLAGKGVKGLAGYAWEEVSSRLGIQGLKEKWKTGWEAGMHKRREARQRRMEAVYEKRRERGSVLQVLASPEHLFEHIWNWKTLGKVMTGRVGDVTGKTGEESQKKADGYNAEIARIRQEFAPDRADEYREMLNKGIASDTKGQRDLQAEKTRVDSDQDTGLLDRRADILDKAADSDENNADFEAANKKRQEAQSMRGQAQQLRGNKAQRLQAINDKLNAADSRLISNQNDLQLSDVELDQRYGAKLESLAAGKRNEVSRLGGGGLTEEQQRDRDKKIQELSGEADKLSEQINVKRDFLQRQGRSQPEIDTLVKKDEDHLERLNDEMTALQMSPATRDERQANVEIAKKLRNEANDLIVKARKAPATEEDKNRWKKEIERLKHLAGVAQKKADHYRLATDYAVRRDQRTAINEEKSKMTTDNWQEQVKIAEDSIHSGDMSRAAAAYIKATEYGNENEFQNWFGYDSDAKGMRKFIEEVFIGKLGMSEEQALSIASDASYAGEKVNHWGVARAVVVKNGKLVWADENQRMIEVLAEVRKKDFEGFVRQANRLAWGNEIVGKEELPPDATAEQRAAHFKAGGGRQFVINDFGKAFLTEKWESFDELIRRGRFNVNLAVKLSEGNNLDEVERLAREKGIIPVEKFAAFQQTLQKIKDFAGTEGRSEFEDLEKIMGTK